MTAHSRMVRRRKMKNLYQRRASYGWVSQGIWIPKSIRDQVRARASQLSTTKQIVFSAALLTGLRLVTPSEIIRTQQQWLDKVQLPTATRFKKGLRSGPRHPVTGCFIQATPPQQEGAA